MGSPSTWAARAASIALTCTLLLASGVRPAYAQAETVMPGSTVRVANTDGQRLNVRAGPSVQAAIVARLAPGETATAIGPAVTVGATRWLPLRTAAGQQGWVAAQYVEVVSAPTAAVATTPTATPSPTPAAEPSRPSARQEEREEPKGRPVQVEAKLKFPEVQGREQEITVWVTRDGAPVPGAIVTLETSDGDDEEHFRQLDPTDEEGRTRRIFDVRHEKGTVELQVEAVAPDGGEGRTVVSYFRR